MVHYIFHGKSLDSAKKRGVGPASPDLKWDPFFDFFFQSFFDLMTSERSRKGEGGKKSLFQTFSEENIMTPSLPKIYLCFLSWLFARADIPCPDTEQYLIFTKPSQVLFSIGYLLIFLVSTQSLHIFHCSGKFHSSFSPKMVVFLCLKLNKPSK